MRFFWLTARRPVQAKTIHERFVDFADWISEKMGSPANIMFWVFLVIAWCSLFAFHIFDANTAILPAWFTSNAFNFPLNTVTTLAELYIGFLLAASANRVEKRNRELHTRMATMIKHIEDMEAEELTKL